MVWQIKSPFESPVESPVEKLDRELVARGARVPGEERFQFNDKEGTHIRNQVMARVKKLYDAASQPDKAMEHLSTQELIKMLIDQVKKDSDVKGIWYKDDRLDYYEIDDQHIKRNADCVAAVCMKSDLMDMKNGTSKIKVKNYGITFNLCQREPFHHHPAAVGPLCSGFLVKEDMVVTASHFVNKGNLKALRFVFGFKMKDISTPVSRVSNENIYKGAAIVARKYNRNGDGSDWAVVKLDRKVRGQAVAKLSKKPVFSDQPAYAIGYPMGLPLKYAPGICVCDVNKACFSARLDIYSGNSGSPIFDGNTHEVIGMAVRGYQIDFRWGSKCWFSVIYPGNDKSSPSPQCTRVSEFIHACK